MCIFFWLHRTFGLVVTDSARNVRQKPEPKSQQKLFGLQRKEAQLEKVAQCQVTATAQPSTEHFRPTR